ncbi:phosphoenolpyruvate--protein phosphotransferase [Endozoicomonas sp. OPT23]|uniref:phosphoenolpyruvate--protein phosphotransferase n=1 Tax=Endozoicomonas sp. OPT23 TaxID=2072845 RepID=UPI00129B836A|nr:phosphoenolpyruvate--protein phosphotransferase [Endozoicomonas sp. OPT23]MRI31558.1 phosphoenolpyruvate--protein phosphotransferase [Endozoicomonas sp. OPT23]
MSCKELVFTCELVHGLHARPASALVALAEEFDAVMELENLRTGFKASLDSALSLIAADIAYRDTCKVRVEGSDAQVALKKLQRFVLRELQHFDAEVLIADNVPTLPPSLRNLNINHCVGHSIGSDWVEGIPFCLSEHKLYSNRDNTAYTGISGERMKLLGALEQLLANIRANMSVAELDTEKSILNAHVMLASDQEFKSRLLNYISEGWAASESIKKTLQYYSLRLEAAESSYLRDRVLDIQDLCDQLLHLTCNLTCEKTDSLTAPSICLADNLTPSQFLALDKKYLTGLVLENGGKASHTVLLAQARGIPVIVGVEGARSLMKNAERVILDAKLGVLISDPSEKVDRYYLQEARRQQKLEKKYQPFIHRKAKTADQKRLEVGANIIGLDDAVQAFASGAEGVGLFRTEMMFMERTCAPDMNEQHDVYEAVVDVAEDRPVIIRTIDVGADKPVDYFELPEEQNPFLGFRAVRLYSEFLDVFKEQVRAILKASRNKSLGLMIPMVTTVSEVVWVRKIIAEVQQEMTLAGAQFGRIRLGIMVEVPSACMIIDQLSEYVDFFSIGSNDLAQYVLAADRCNDRIGELYNYLQPAFLRLLDKVVKDARSKNKWIGVCGEMASDINTLPILVGLGVDEISVSGSQIGAIKERISHLDSQQCRKLLDSALFARDYREVSGLLKNTYSELAPRPLFDPSIICIDYDCLSREEAIKQLVDMLYLDSRIADSTSVEEAIWQREDISSTNLGNGIAIPHCRSDLVYSHSIAVLKLAKPIQWQSQDDSLVDTVFILAVREADTPDAHMRFFASLARKLMESDFVKRFRNSASAISVDQLLKSELKLSN